MSFSERRPKTFDGISIGDRIAWTEDSGFQAGQRLEGTVEEIVVIDWEPETANRLGVPFQERFYYTESGCTRGGTVISS